MLYLICLKEILSYKFARQYSGKKNNKAAKYEIDISNEKKKLFIQNEKKKQQKNNYTQKKPVIHRCIYI